MPPELNVRSSRFIRIALAHTRPRYNPRNSSVFALAFIRGGAMSAADARFSQRKEPIQARSRLTVKAIIEATAQVLVAIGYERATTDTIAARAGVSIGTLYQYFSNKESLVAALIKNHVDEIMRTVEAALAEAADAPLESALQAMIHAGVEAHRADPALHKVLFEQVPRNKLLG